MDRAIETVLLELVQARGPDSSVCPSEAARRVEPVEWRPLMEPARRAARRLVAAGRAEITQKGRVVDPSEVRGPIRVRARR